MFSSSHIDFTKLRKLLFYLWKREEIPGDRLNSGEGEREREREGFVKEQKLMERDRYVGFFFFIKKRPVCRL